MQLGAILAVDPWVVVLWVVVLLVGGLLGGVATELEDLVVAPLADPVVAGVALAGILTMCQRKAGRAPLLHLGRL